MAGTVLLFHVECGVVRVDLHSTGQFRLVVCIYIYRERECICDQPTNQYDHNVSFPFHIQYVMY